MNILCDKSKLIEGINIVLKAVPGKSTMAILECIVIDVKENTIKLIANDLQLGIETTIEGNIIEEGSVAVNAKIFSDIIRKLPSDDVKITVDENYTIFIECGKAKFNIAAKSTEEFPFLPSIIKDNNIQISQFTLKDIIRQTVFSISDNENTKVMTGELFEVNGSTLKVVSLDGHRISIRKVDLKKEYEKISVIIPGKTLIEISKILNGGLDDEVNIFFTDKHVLFEFDNTVVLSRLIEGEYYKIDKMLSTDYETKITVNKKEMLECIDRTTLLLKESDKKPVIIDIKDNSMGFAMNSSVGSMAEEIDAEKEGKDILIGFNPRFLIDALRVIDEEEITLYMINPKAPCFIRDKDETYIYLILPVNFNA
ncbi:MAG: DNA polymerase III subunit beta [Lachnospiraceae bacterium]|nr:DNA polymerase III subunit beta [Lachnospiraceae bacterium]